MKKFFCFFVFLALVACGYEGYQETPVEYTNEVGQLGGKCVLPMRTCYCYPQCYCEGDNLRCEPMPDRDIKDEDNILEDDDNILPDSDSISEGWS